VIELTICRNQDAYNNLDISRIWYESGFHYSLLCLSILIITFFYFWLTSTDKNFMIIQDKNEKNNNIKRQ
jgi:hypothetical protein